MNSLPLFNTATWTLSESSSSSCAHSMILYDIMTYPTLLTQVRRLRRLLLTVITSDLPYIPLMKDCQVVWQVLATNLLLQLYSIPVWRMIKGPLLSPDHFVTTSLLCILESTSPTYTKPSSRAWSRKSDLHDKTITSGSDMTWRRLITWQLHNIAKWQSHDSHMTMTVVMEGL